MAEIIGKDIEVGFAVENERGTAQTSAEKWMKKVVADILIHAEHAIDDGSRGVLEDSDSRRVVKKWIEGALEGVVQADAIGYLFYNLYGADAESNVSGSVYDHVFTLSESIEHASLSFFLKDGAVQQKVYNNGMVGSMELIASTDDLVRFTANIIAKDEADNSDTPGYNTEYDFIGRDIEIKVADTEGGLGDATATKIKNLLIKWDPGIVKDHVLGAYVPDDIYNAKMSIEGNFTKNFNDATFKDLFANDSSKYIQITITGAADIGGGSYPTITLLLYKARVTEWTRAGGQDELVTETVEFKAFYNADDKKQSQLTLRNLTEEYDIAPTA